MCNSFELKLSLGKLFGLKNNAWCTAWLFLFFDYKGSVGDLIKSSLSFKEMICSRGGVPKLMKMRLLRWCCNYISPLARLLVLVPETSQTKFFKLCNKKNFAMSECSIGKKANMLYVFWPRSSRCRRFSAVQRKN